MDIKSKISIATGLAFLIGLLLSRNVRQAYITLVILLMPFIDLKITTPETGSFAVFEFTSFCTFALNIKEFDLPRNKFSVSSILFAALSFILIIGCLASKFVGDALVGYIKCIAIFIYGKILVDECIANEKFLEKVLNLLRISCLLSLLFLAVQMLSGLEFSFYDDLNVNTVVETGVRYPSYFSDPQKYAQFLTMLSFLFLIRAPENTFYNRVRYPLFFLIILALLITGGRAASLGFAVALFLIFLLGNKKYKVIGFACAGIGALCYVAFSDHLMVFNREQTIDDSYDFRHTIWKGAFDIFLQQPVLGIGVENYQNYVTQYKQDHFWELDGIYMYMDHPENGYLKLLTEFGIFGFLITASFIARPVRQSLKFYMKKQTDLRGLFITVSIIAFLISFITVYSLSDKRVLLVLVSLICVLTTYNKNMRTSNG